MGHDGGTQHTDGNVEALWSEGGDDGVVDGLVPVCMDEEKLNGVAAADDADEGHDDEFDGAEAVELKGEDGEDTDGCDECGNEHDGSAGEAKRLELLAEEEIEAEGGTEEFGEVGGEGGEFGGNPQADNGGTGEMVATILRECTPGDDAEFGREELHEDGHEVGPEQDPEQVIAEAGASVNIGGEVAGVNIGDAGYEGGAEEIEELVAALWGCLRHGLY